MEHQRRRGNADYVNDMVLDDSGNIYVCGDAWEGTTTGKYNWVTIKYNTKGDLVWLRKLNWIANENDECFGMTIDKDRNIYITGFGRVTTLEKAMITVKYSSNGDSIWAKSYTSLPQRSNWGYSVVTDDSNNVYSSGYGAVPTGNEIITIKYDTNGNEKWIRTFPTNDGDYLRPTISKIDKLNNLIVVGNSNFSNTHDFGTLKYTLNGDLLWSRIYNGGNIDRANSMIVDSNSNILIAGFSFTTTYGDFLILKYSPDGDTLLKKTINGEASASDEALSISVDTSGNVYTTGNSLSLTNTFDYLTVKLDSFGIVAWSKRYHGTYDNYAYGLCLDRNNNIYVAGHSYQNGSNSGIVTIKYSQLTGILLNAENHFDNYSLSNHPNPFNATTEINYQIPYNSVVKLKIYNVEGKEIETSVDEFKNGGNYEIFFDGNNYSSGIYFYSLIVNNEIIKTNRMLLIK